MYLQTGFESELFQAYGTNISLDTGVSRQMVEVILASRVAFATSIAPIPRRHIVYVPNVLYHALLGDKCAIALRADKATAVYGSNVTPKLAFPRERQITFGTFALVGSEQLRACWLGRVVCRVSKTIFRLAKC